jgi:hypothetical protein
VGRPTVFISYSHQDEAWKDRLTKHLRTLEAEGVLAVWDDRKISAGADWASEIAGAIGRSAVAVLLISVDFLTSPFILENEVPHLIRRRTSGQLRIIPVIIHPCPWQEVKWLASLQCRPKDGKALSGWKENEVEEALAALAREIRALVSPDNPDRRQAAAPPALRTAPPLRPTAAGPRVQQPKTQTTTPPTSPLPHVTSRHPKQSPSSLSWVGGCAAIIVIGLIAVGGIVGAGGYFAKRAADKYEKNPTLATAELMVRANPDLELVSSDEKTNTLTVRAKKTGEMATVSADDIKNGKFTVKSDKGAETFDARDKDGGSLKVTDDKGQVTTMNPGVVAPQNLPSWVPVYPGGEVKGTFDTTNAEGHSGTFTVSTTDSVSKMMEFYESQLKSAGLKTEKTPFSGNGQEGGTVTAKSSDERWQASVLFGSANGQSTATVTYMEKK